MTDLPPAQDAVAFQLLVSNQSFDVDPVDVDLYVDGVHVVRGNFEVGSQHTWVPFDFSIAPGEHTLRAVSKKGNVETTKPFTVTTKQWAVVQFWFYETARGGQPAGLPSLSVDFFDKAPQFM